MRAAVQNLVDPQSQDGIVRAAVVLLLTVGFIAFVFLTTILYVNHESNDALKAVMTGASGALGLAFASATGVYFGVRSQQPAIKSANALVAAQQNHIQTLSTLIPTTR